MKLFSAIIFIFSTSLFAQSVVELFKKEQYSYLCLHRWKYINKYQLKREDLLSLVAYACIKKHYLTPALDLAKTLRMTKEGRINATYITTLYLIKLLIIHYLNNEKEFLNVSIPNIENDLLGYIFTLIQKQKPPVVNLSTEVADKNKRYVIEFKPKINNLIINIYNGQSLIKKEIYW